MGPRAHGTHGGGTTTMQHDVQAAMDMEAPAAAPAAEASQLPRGSGKVQLDPWSRELVCGVVAGATNVASGFPFDTVKVRLQSAEQGTYKGPLHCLRSILRTEGARGLFRGLTPPLVGGALETGVNYLVYCRVLSALQQQYATATPCQGQGSPGVDGAVQTRAVHATTGAHVGAAWELPSRHVPVAGAAAGVALSFILGPTELIKCRMQASGSPYTGPMHCIRATLASEGLRGLTRGLGATMAREVPGNALFFTVYEGLKHNLKAVWDSGSGAQRQASHGGGSSSRGLAAVLQDAGLAILCGGTAGTVMWATVLPLDVAKTRLQTAAPGSAWDVGISRHLAMLWREGGMRALWCGLTPTLLRAFPANAAQWLAWEAAMSAMGAGGGHSGH